ncbi:MAG: transcription-repair coupling factor [Bacteroidetes bacterium]|nr:transcription-repair coupling factor [Bacteroidota bacterium]MCW5894605.1 transcription-repair coupling factor [Bacteroidota bacterium]
MHGTSLAILMNSQERPGGAVPFMAITMIEKIKTTISDSSKTRDLLALLSAGPPAEIHATGLAGSMRSFLVGSLAETLPRQILCVVPDKETTIGLRDDLEIILGEQSVRLFSAAKSREEGNDRAISNTNDIETLRSLLDAGTRIIVTQIHALTRKLPNPSSLRDRQIKIGVGSDFDFSRLLHLIVEFGFEKKQFVAEHGDYSVRGGILDVYPFVGENPVRIEFWGDRVESIREFDPISQRSIKDLSQASIIPDLLGTQIAENGSSGSTLLDFLPSNAIIVLEEPDALHNAMKEYAEKAGAETKRAWEQTQELMALFSRINISSLARSGLDAVDFGTLSQPSINGSVKVLRNHISDLQDKDYSVFVSSDTTAEQERLKDLLMQLEPLAENEERVLHETEHHLDVFRIEFSLESLHGGFILPDERVAVFTEHQIFNRLKRRGKQPRTKFRSITQRELHELRKGDYVVHADFGIGRFDGLRRIRVRDVEQEVVKLLYEEKDTLYVNLNYLNKVQKYASKEGHVPKLTRLGSGEWDRLKARAKKRVKDIARDLIKLYAKRKSSPGFSFQRDSLWQQELEATFMYEDTPDQAQSTADVKKDMEAPFPMDRLVCGDVGFGKTEVAVRAAFKAVMSGKQVVVLVPTTILAQQHYSTFLDRLSKYATRVEVLSRFKTKKEQTEILDRVKAGTADIVIGTHRLLSRDVEFKDLGLLIIDEEHRFGVAAKEKLRQIKANVDTLTLTATPIPRTLHFSLMGARDLSIIATPPLNRLPVTTEIAQYNEEHVREAILREIQRGGQVFFVHDRVNNMDELIARLQTILPHVKFRQAHGQMHAHELENVMLAFLERKFDVLVATKIIESGIDIPSVNTIIINRADRFGMAELYQLRGRVGRSNVQAYAYLLIPPLSVLPRETVRRLQAVEEFTELGSGFNLAMRDLEIRGAGNLLGGEQSGFIESMGFEMYTKILEEAVAELKEQEFQDLFGRVESRVEAENQAVVEADFDVRIPDSYIESDNERLVIYRRLYAVVNNDTLREIAAELVDRFGKHPDEVENLFNLVRIRLKASKLGFRKVNISKGGLSIEFPPETESAFYESDRFQLLMTHIAQKMKKRAAIRQNGKSLILTCSFAQSGNNNPFAHSELILDELKEVASPPETEPANV